MDFKTSLRRSLSDYVRLDEALNSPEYKKFLETPLMESSKILLREYGVIAEATLQRIAFLLTRLARNGEVGPKELQTILSFLARREEANLYTNEQEQQAAVQIQFKEVMQSSDVLAQELKRHGLRWATMSNDQMV